jgi:hypothetical protein
MNGPGMVAFHVKMVAFLLIFIFLTSTFCSAQRNEAELFTQHQEAFCLLWKNSRIEQQYALATLCFRRVRQFGDQVHTLLLALTCNTFNLSDAILKMQHF